MWDVTITNLIAIILSLISLGISLKNYLTNKKFQLRQDRNNLYYKLNECFDAFWTLQHFGLKEYDKNIFYELISDFHKSLLVNEFIFSEKDLEILKDLDTYMIAFTDSMDEEKKRYYDTDEANEDEVYYIMMQREEVKKIFAKYLKFK